MISYEELCEALERWRARMYGEPQDSPKEREAQGRAPETEMAGVTPMAMVAEHTNEIDLDSVDVVDS